MAQTIFDVGLHKGEDAEFYLKKGFRVVGVEANPELCRSTSERLKGYVDSGQLTIVNRAIADKSGSIEFYTNDISEWGTVSPDWAHRNERLGHPPLQRITVEAVTLAELVQQFGTPHFVKIDIEGMDLPALRSLTGTSERPRYVSIESEKMSFSALRNEFALFQELGYDRFKIVPQHRVHEQKPPSPAREGQFADHSFQFGSSGLFGEEAPGAWITADEAIDRYKSIFLRYHLAGDDPLVRSRFARALLRRALGFVGWYDTHARLSYQTAASSRGLYD
jgi:FkbM family methyltransferase